MRHGTEPPPLPGHRGRLPPRASVIVVHYDAEEKLARCLASIARTAPGETSMETIVVDNGDRPGLGDRLGSAFPWATLVRPGRNAGFGAGCNLGAERAEGEFLVFLNPDTLVEEGWLDGLISAFEGSARTGLATSKLLLFDPPDRINACGNDVHVSGLTLCRGLGAPRGAFADPEEVGAVSGAAFAMRRSTFRELGGFDETAFLYMEDTDLSLRARLAGWRCLYVPESVVFHDYALRIGPRKIFYQERNRYLMLTKSLRWPTLLVLSPVFLLAEVLTWGFVLWKGGAADKVRAYAWMLRNAPAVLGKRRAVQASRRASDRALLLATVPSLDFGQLGSGVLPRAAGVLFNPLFAVLRGFALALVWW